MNQLRFPRCWEAEGNRFKAYDPIWASEDSCSKESY